MLDRFLFCIHLCSTDFSFVLISQVFSTGYFLTILLHSLAFQKGNAFSKILEENFKTKQDEVEEKLWEKRQWTKTIFKEETAHYALRQQ